MEFQQIDRILAWEPGKQIIAARSVHAGESILQDHFPRFAVLPGVLMLEACFQAGMYLMLVSDDFRRPWVTLKAVRNAKYSDFVTPAQTLTVTMDVVKQDQQSTTFKAKGVVSGPDKEPNGAFSARLILSQSTLAETYPNRAASESALRFGLREQWYKLTENMPAQESA